MKFSSMMFLALATILSPFANAASTAPESGLLITRVNSQQWQVRLIAGGSAQQFSGVLESRGRSAPVRRNRTAPDC